MNSTVLIARLIATLIPLLVLYMIYRLDLYSTGDFKFTIYSFIWGGIAFYFAVIINTKSVELGIVSDFTMMAKFVAPPVEEILKALILIILVTRPKFTYFVDALIYGFAAGIGFAIIENYDYIFYNLAASLDIAITRVISTNLIHGTASAFVGLYLGRARFNKGTYILITALTGYLYAIGLHTAFNNFVNLPNISFIYILIVATAIGVGGTIFIANRIKIGLKEAKTWIEEKLGMEDRVTSGEAAAVNHLEDIDEFLAPLKDMFGEEKVGQIKRFLQIQAEVGIRRKKLDEMPDGKSKEAARQEITKITTEMDVLRKEVGTYTMMQLRGIFPIDDSPLWEQLGNVIEDRIKHGGGSDEMWKNLEKKSDEKSSSMFDKIG